MLDKDAIKYSLTEQDIIKIANSLGGTFIKKDFYGNLIFNTFCHNKTGGSHKLYYYIDSSQFHCYTECGNFDVYELVSKVKILQGYDIDFIGTVKYVADITGKEFIQNNSNLTQKKTT